MLLNYSEQSNCSMAQSHGGYMEVELGYTCSIWFVPSFVVPLGVSPKCHRSTCKCKISGFTKAVFSFKLWFSTPRYIIYCSCMHIKYNKSIKASFIVQRVICLYELVVLYDKISLQIYVLFFATLWQACTDKSTECPIFSDETASKYIQITCYTQNHI